MRYKAIFQVEGNQELLYKCLSQEQDKKDRFELKIRKRPKMLEIIMLADDHIALKAITNSMSKMLELYERLEKIEL
ncbi:TPA: hypothetical protein HA246_06560 [Candidatus Woesearchaeota archaeon]|nr:hypothetical protein [Candidatus Woesearchaeota archaeon]